MQETAQQFKKRKPEGIIQDGKYFIESPYRKGYYVWVNRPINRKSFDYQMCGCGRIISNCGFSIRHKCKTTPASDYQHRTRLS